MGWALRREGLPSTEPFILDVELWPLSRGDKREAMTAAFNTWLANRGVAILDRINAEDFVAFRVRFVLSNDAGRIACCRHRDVRTKARPAATNGIFWFKLGILSFRQSRYSGSSRQETRTPGDAPFVAVLDSGIAEGHPLLAPALGDAQGFVLPDKEESHRPGRAHGTLVAVASRSTGISPWRHVLQAKDIHSTVATIERARVRSQ